MPALTIGMATYDDFDGVYFTLQALRLYQDLADTELVVVDNYGCEHTRTFVEGWAQGRYVRATDVVGTAAPRERLFQEARGEAVLCCDSHVLFAPGAIARLRAYYRDHPDCIDLVQGPLVYDDLQNISTHFEPVWREQMWGVWATDPRGLDPEGESFEIPMQGLGVFSCRQAVWPGFNPAFRGFGGEEGYIHEKFRQRGGRCLCLPWLRWVHRFGRPAGVPYPLYVEDKLHNYLVGHAELGLDLAPVLEHFRQHLPEERVAQITQQALREERAGSAADNPPVRLATDPAPPRRLPPALNYTPFPQPAVAKICPPPALASGEAGLPLVSCLCLTYGRPPDHQWLLEEAIESFLRQTYPHKELLVLNDCPDQEVECDAPGVRVVNIPHRFPSVGEKYNAAVALARGELLAPWDDDDISLPWRLALSVAWLGEAQYFNPRCYWFWDHQGLHADHASGYAHNASLIRRTAFAAVGGSPAISLGYDAKLDAALARLDPVVDPLQGAPALTRAEWFYIYRWGVSPVHLSSRGEASFYQEIGARPVVAGQYRLQPHWRADYTAATRQVAAG